MKGLLIKRNDNKFYPVLFAISGFVYSVLAGILNFFFNPAEKPWVNLCFSLPLIIFSVIALYVYAKSIKAVIPKDIYIPPIIFTVLFCIASYGLVLINPTIFLRTAYWSVVILYEITANCFLILTVIPKIPRKRFVILSYIGVFFLISFGIIFTVYNCFDNQIQTGAILKGLLIIRENLIS